MTNEERLYRICRGCQDKITQEEDEHFLDYYYRQRKWLVEHPSPNPPESVTIYRHEVNGAYILSRPGETCSQFYRRIEREFATSPCTGKARADKHLDQSAPGSAKRLSENAIVGAIPPLHFQM